MADPMLGMGSPLWALPNLTPPEPDLQQTAVDGNQLAAGRPASLQTPSMQSQSWWDHNNMQVGQKQV